MALARNLPAGLYRSSKGVAGPGGVARGPRGRGGGAADRQAGEAGRWPRWGAVALRHTWSNPALSEPRARMCLRGASL